MKIEIGDYVVPINPAGLWLSAEKHTGKFRQKRSNSCSLQSVGKVLLIDTFIVDYDEWEVEDKGLVEDHLGQVSCTQYLIQTESGGIGWGSSVKFYKRKEINWNVIKLPT